MRGLLTRTAADASAGVPRYAQVVYLTAPAARPVVARAIAGLPGPLAARMTARDLPPEAAL